MGALALCATLLLLSSSLAPLCRSDDTLLPSESLLTNQTLVSDGKTFALGFFTPRASPSRHYLGIWYNNIPIKTYVWVANSENPFTDPSVVLRISNHSNLVVSNTLGMVLWSSNTSGAAPPTGSSTAAVLRDTGNLQLMSSKVDVLWQSFDYPADTVLPGMKLWVKKKIHEANRITSWKGADDPSLGDFSYGIDPVTTIQMVIWKGLKPYRRTGVWSGFLTSGGPMTKMGYASSFSIQRNEEMSNITFSPSDTSVIQRIVLDSTGVVWLFYWNSSINSWSSMLWYADAKLCDTYGACGPFGVCSTRSSGGCSCLEGYEPRVQSEWNRGVYSSGCARRRASTCDSKDGFSRMANVMVPDKMVFLRNVINGSDCEAACRSNCSCTAYSYASATYDTTNISRCLVWGGLLIDLIQFTTNGEDFYLRVPGNATVISDGKSNTHVVWMLLPVVCLALVLCVSVYLCWKYKAMIKGWRKNGKKTADALVVGRGFSRDALVEFSGSNFLLEDEQKEGNSSDLPMLNFDTIAAATDKFSDSNKLGQGGFGDVYRGVLPGGKVVAVKRLSRSSGQGLDEFKTEVVLIAKLQHRNLVRLLGCCIQGEEKILIYEYMPNKSLDFFLFNPARQPMLDWGKRFDIIEGIARGILYLHRDSRLRIVHRDLKASNILLDEEMNPRISDFGMARIFGGNQSCDNTNRIVGTFGYMPPEYAMEGLFSVKSDVYSFGVIMLEIVSGKKNIRFGVDYINLLRYAWQLWATERAEEIIDPSIRCSCPTEQALRCIQIGLLCVQDRTADRPTMSSVVIMLGSEAPINQTPKQPTFALEDSPSEMDSLKRDLDGSYSNDVTISTVSGR